MRPAGILRSPIWIRPRRNVPVVRTTAPAVMLRPPAVSTPLKLPSCTIKSLTPASTTPKRGVAFIAPRLPRRDHLASGRGPGALPARTFAAVQHAELDSGLVRDPPHESIERIDLPNQMALAQASDCRVARHLADGGEAMCYQRRARAHARGRGGCLAAPVPSPDDDDVEALAHGPVANLFAPARQSGHGLFHVNHLPMQNSPKMAPRTSSTSILPVSRPTW